MDNSSLKRRHPAAAAAGDGVLFRLLCPAALSRGLIGKGGAVVRHIQAATGAKIHVDDPIHNDCIIHVISESNPTEPESPAQRALVMVFERVVKTGIEMGDDVQGGVSCRLLAPEAQARCVVGVGGRNVDLIVHETGAMVRVFTFREQLLPPGDEMIQITGDLLSVRKALLSVSSCLQDNHRTEPTGFPSTSPFGANIRGVGPPTLGDPNAQRSFFPRPHSQGYHPRAYSSNPGMNLFTPGPRMYPEEEVIFRILCSNEKVGSIIGKAGAVIHSLQSETGASITVADSNFDSEEKVIVICALENADPKHSPAQKAILLVHSRLAEAGHDRGPVVSARLLVPKQQMGCLVGQDATIVAEMRRATGASIFVFANEHLPKCAHPNDELIEVRGTGSSVRDALLHITGRIRKFIFGSKPHAHVNSYMSAATEVPMHRPRMDSTHTGHYSTSGISHGLHPSGGLYDPTDRQSPFSHGADSIDPHRTPFSYGAESSGRRPPFDHSPSPRLWTPQGLNIGNCKGTPDAGMGINFPSGMTESGSQTPTTTHTTVRVVVPQHLLGFLYGEDSKNLFEIRELSGAQVSIFDPKAGVTEGEVIISGSPDQTKMAQSLLHAFIFCGQESC